MGFMLVTGFCSTLVLERISLKTAPCGEGGRGGWGRLSAQRKGLLAASKENKERPGCAKGVQGGRGCQRLGKRMQSGGTEVT